MNLIFYHVLGMEKSSQLTFIFFRGVAKPPTSLYFDVMSACLTRCHMCWSCCTLFCQVDLLVVDINRTINKHREPRRCISMRQYDYAQQPAVVLHVDALLIQHVMRSLAQLSWNSTMTSGIQTTIYLVGGLEHILFYHIL